MKYMMQRTSRKCLVARPRIANMDWLLTAHRRFQPQPGFDPAVHVFFPIDPTTKTWPPGSSPGEAIFGGAAELENAGGAQPGDIGLVVAELAQDLVVVLAEIGGREAHPRRLGRLHHVDGLADDLQFAEPLVVHRPRHFEVLDLRIGKGLVDRVERPARHAAPGQTPAPKGAGPAI